MQRVTISLDETIAALFDTLLIEQGYRNRSEAVRGLVRDAVEARRLDAGSGTHCIASLSYVYDFRTRKLAARLLEIRHEHHELVVSTTHVVLDHAAALETVVLKGPTVAVRKLADAITTERGVRFGAINLVSVQPNDHHENATAHHHHHDFGHVSPHAG